MDTQDTSASDHEIPLFFRSEASYSQNCPEVVSDIVGVVEATSQSIPPLASVSVPSSLAPAAECG